MIDFWKRVVGQFLNFNSNSDLFLSNTAVLLIDMQDKFVNKIRPGRADLVIAAQIEVLKRCNEYNVPVVVLEFRRFGKTIFEIKKELYKVSTVRTIKKNRDSGFLNTALKNQLRVWGTKNVILMGINAECCVKETAEDAIDNGLNIVTSPDLISGPEHHAKDDCIGWYELNGSVIVKEDIFTAL